MKYNPKAIEKKWQKYWFDHGMFEAKDFGEKPKYYALVEFPYPSGAGMHVGHIRAYTSLEIVARKRRMEGYNVLFPIGFDAFGLPTENYAMKQQIHPRKVTDENIAIFTEQLKRAGFSFDFSRVVDTTDPAYYKWTQWIFVQLFKKGLAYRSTTHVNYCPSCKVVLSNEESQGGVCDRCGSQVVQKEKDVWFLKITAYAERLLDGLETLDTNPRIKREQRNWIGKSVGAEVDFPVPSADETLKVFTTRPDTLFGATFMVVAPEHPILDSNKAAIQNWEAIKAYREQAALKTEFERTELQKDKTGVKVEGLHAINPVNHEEIPLFVADYVMMDYGTGAIMAVPAHDERDYAFAKTHGLQIREVIAGGDIEKEAYTDVFEGTLINSGFLNGMNVPDAVDAMIEHLQKEALGEKAVNFKMKDWAFNRQRYWGEPIPIIHCEKCGMVPVPEDALPVTLPDLEKFEPGDNGESPLASVDAFVQTTCPKCGGDARRETDTMPQWAGSSWYFLRYTDPRNDGELANYHKLKYWLPVDWYNGGMEHVTRHVIYSRFWHQFLYDIGVVPTREPYKKRTNQGLILGPDGDKMSKSKGNVVNPMETIERYGADTLRVYILFIGDYEQSTPWSEEGVKGARRFLDKVWRLFEKVAEGASDSNDLITLLNKTIKGVGEDIETVKFNTAIAKLMTFVNEALKQDAIHKTTYETFLRLLNPFAPHIAEELNDRLGEEAPMVHKAYPEYDPEKLIEDTVTIVLQVNGKVREKIEVEKNLPKETLESLAKENERVKKFTEGKTIRKVIVVPDKLVNIVAN
ncbi:MAG: leucine--tRNA ligase [Bacillota bacterium]